jgi:hypothetical protein
VYEVEEFPPTPWRRRLLILLLAVGTALTIAVLMLVPPGGIRRKLPLPPPDAARCAQGQTQDCVGGTVQVIVAPAASAAR